MESDPILECRDIAFERDDLPLFQGVNFRLEGGRALRVVGANGTGKTTLLRVCATALGASEGDLFYRGKSLRQGRQQYCSEMLFLGHEPAVKGGLTPRENLAWFFRLYPANGLAPDEALKRVGLAGFESVPCHTLSAGQLRRVALARLYMSAARLWILDEPFTAIDAAGVAQLEELMADHLQAAGALLLTTHQPLTLTDMDTLDLESYARAA